MERRIWSWVTLGLTLIATLPGCEKFQSQSTEQSEAAALEEFGDGEGNSSKRARATTNIAAPADNFTLRLQPGDRFPLIKTVEQRLLQRAAQGGPLHESSSQLTMTLAIQVEEIKEGVKRLGVRYQRVRYEQDIAGEKVSFDSAIPPSVSIVPEAAQVYQGLVDNGFSFWLGGDQRIVKVEDFDVFLKRCVRHAPADQQAGLLTRLVASTEDEGIANFVDDSLGILPEQIDDRNPGGTVRVGETWRRSRQIVRPLPMTIDTMFRLESLNERYATIELLGKIVPAQIELLGGSAAQRAGLSEKMTLRQGHTAGTCVIDRQSGLPLQSRVVRHLEMSLELPNGSRFDQFKDITTTIRAFPDQHSGSADLPSDPQAVSRPQTRQTPRDAKVVPTGFAR